MIPIARFSLRTVQKAKVSAARKQVFAGTVKYGVLRFLWEATVPGDLKLESSNDTQEGMPTAAQCPGPGRALRQGIKKHLPLPGTVLHPFNPCT